MTFCTQCKGTWDRYYLDDSYICPKCRRENQECDLKDAHARVSQLREEIASIRATSTECEGVERLKSYLGGWVLGEWDSDVKNRPLVNIYRKSLDSIWRCVYKKITGNDLPRPSHEELCKKDSIAFDEKGDRRPIRDEVLWFASRMEAKLRENDHKSHWSECSFSWLLGRLDEETKELIAEWKRASERGFTKEQAHRIAEEAADIANFALFIADNARRKSDAKEEEDK
jgi:NTP pyrophosphatase (non-canonical NTP hydrolase)